MLLLGYVFGSNDKMNLISYQRSPEPRKNRKLFERF